jgi:acyl carrier protein
MGNEASLLAKIAYALGVAPDRIHADTQAVDVEEWDSMGNMTILLTLRRDYGVTLEPNEAAGLQSVEAIASMLRLKGKLA